MNFLLIIISSLLISITANASTTKFNFVCSTEVSEKKLDENTKNLITSLSQGSFSFDDTMLDSTSSTYLWNYYVGEVTVDFSVNSQMKNYVIAGQIKQKTRI